MVKIIAFEGIDYSGKTTTIQYISKFLEKNCKIIINKGPIYPTKLTSTLLSISDQSDELDKEFLYTTVFIKDKIEAQLNYSNDDRIILQDRYWPSVISYGRFLNKEKSIYQYQNFRSLFIEPITTILLSCSYDEMLKRSKYRSKNSSIDALLLNFPEEVERLNDEIEKSVVGLDNIYRIDTTKIPIEEVGCNVMDHLVNLRIVA